MSTLLSLTLSFLILHLVSRFDPHRLIFLAACSHPASLPPLRRTRDHSLTNEILIVRPIALAPGAASCLLYSEEFFDADVMQSTATSHIRTSLALILV